MLATLILAFLIVSFSNFAVGRERWLERDNRALFLHPRRFSQEQPAILTKLKEACPGEICGILAGQAVAPLLAAQPECLQQDLADAIIDASKQFNAAIRANMVSIAIEYRQAERNTPPDFSTNPPTLRNSVFCQRAPRNSELNGLVQAQDPDNDPNLFFDPTTGLTVRKGDQPNTFPFGQTAADVPPSVEDATLLIGGDIVPDSIPVFVVDGSEDATGTDTACPTAITISVTGDAPSLPTDAVTVTAGGDTPIATTTTSPSNPIPTGDIGDFGSCTVPRIEFGAGFDGRKETSFRPVDRNSFNHASDKSIDVITQFICDALINLCRADDTARRTCATARSAASAATNGTGAQADAFNAGFGAPTKFADVTALDEEGNPIPGTGVNRDPGQSASATTASASSRASASATSLGSSVTSTSAPGFGNFGSCSTPEIEFGTGFDNRRETSFRPTDRGSFNIPSSQNIDTIARGICDALSSTCGADRTAVNTCNTASTAASTAARNTGAQADAFNAAFGRNTNFAAVQPVTDASSGAGNGGTSTTLAAPVPSTPTTTRTPTPTPSPGNNNNNGGNNGNNGGGGNSNEPENLQTFQGALGGIRAPPVMDAGNGRFQVEGNTFNNVDDARRRSCDIQVNECSNAANASGNQGDFTVGNCGRQGESCRASV